MTTVEIPVKAKAAPIVLMPDSWQARLVRKAEAMHALGKPVILVVRCGDCPPHWFRTVLDIQDK